MNSPSSNTLPSSSSATATDHNDVESQKFSNRQSHFKVVFDQAGVTDDVINFTYPGQGTAESPYVIDFLPDDAHNAMTFPTWKKWTITGLQAVATLAVAFVSTAYSGGISEVISDFGVSTTVAILGVSLFVLGFALGPLLWAPLSELYGRQILFFVSYLGLTAFNCGAAAAPSMGALITLRFFAGSFGSSPLTNAGGVIADMFQARERGVAMAIFAAAPFLGPTIGPIAGGFLGEASGWRWVEGMMAIFTGAVWIVNSLFVPETYAPVLLRRRASKLSKLTGKHYLSKYDAHSGGRKTLGREFKIGLSRPWIMLFHEPIVSLTAVYMAIIYGTLYMCFAAFPIVFQQQRGWSAGVGGLAFIGIAVGMFFGVGYSILDNKRYAKVMAAHGGIAPPESRLPPVMVGSVLIPAGLFWFAWTDGLDVHWIVPIVGSAVFAAGLVLVFLGLMNYLIDSYVIFAASVLAASAVIRSLFGAAFPLFTTQMYNNLGIHWAASVPAFLALACLPFPFLFYHYGARIRKHCRFAAEAELVLQRMIGGGGPKQPDPVEVDEDEAMQEVERKVTERRSLERKMTLERKKTQESRKSKKEGALGSIFSR